MAREAWESLPDVAPKADGKASSWEDLPDITEPRPPDDLNSVEGTQYADKPKDTGLFSDVPDIARSGVQGAAMGYADEGEAAIRSALPGSKSYSEERDALRPKYDKAVRDYPVMNVAGAIGVPIPGTGKLRGAAKIAGMVGQGIGIGGLNALGNSTADLTEGKYGDAAKDTATGATIGGVVSGTLGAIGGGLPRLAKVLREKATGAVTDAGNLATKAIDKGIASAKGAFGSSVQQASRILENLEREAAHGVGRAKEAALEFLASPEAVALREQVLLHQVEAAPGKMGEMQRLLAEFGAKKDAAPGDIAAKTGELLSLGKQVSPRARLLANRFIPPLVGAGAGEALDGHRGGAIGTGLGTAISLTQGRPGTVIQNMVQSPAFRKAGYGVLAKGAEALAAPINWVQKLPELLQSAPEKLGRYGPALLLELNKNGREGLAKMDHALAQEDPEYRDLREAQTDPSGELLDYFSGRP